ncbi:MAG: hypothetical protein MAG795_00343 [Candidatus Woesearchaeota archaeon]|nr:hypothetical protein [Candidatus Woesearchaeota archaeon]
MSLIHIIVIVFGLFAISRAYLRYKESKVKLGELLFWTGIWGAAMVFAFFPDTLNWLSDRAGFRRGMDFLIAISVITLFYLVFRIYVKLDETGQDITKIIREIAKSKK